MQSIRVLGLNACHADSAACLLIDGVLRVAVEEERLRRVKHWAGVPTEAVRCCLQETGLTLGDITHIALNQDSSANIGRRVSYVLTRRPDLSMILDRVRNRRDREGVDVALARALGQPFEGTLHFVEHHLAHLASAFLVSPFERAATVSVDGFGDFASAVWGFGDTR